MTHSFPYLAAMAAETLWKSRAPSDVSDVSFSSLPTETQERFLRDAIVVLSAAGVEDALIDVDRMMIDHAAEIARWTDRARKDQQTMRQANHRTAMVYRLLRDLVEGKIEGPDAVDRAGQIANLS